MYYLIIYNCYALPDNYPRNIPLPVLFSSWAFSMYQCFVMMLRFQFQYVEALYWKFEASVSVNVHNVTAAVDQEIFILNLRIASVCPICPMEFARPFPGNCY